MISGLAQAIGVSAILPFMALATKPSQIHERTASKYLYHTFGFEQDLSFLIFVGVLTVTALALSNAMSAYATWLTNQFTWGQNHDLSMRLFQSYLDRPYPWFLSANSSTLVKDVVSEVETLIRGYLQPLTLFAVKMATAVVIILVLLIVDWKVALATLVCCGGAYLALFRIVRRRLAKIGQLRLASDAAKYKTASEAFVGIKTTKVLGCEPYFSKTYDEHSANSAHYRAVVGLISQLPRYAMETVAFGGIVSVVLYLLYTQRNPSEVLPLLSLYAVAGFRLMPALQQAFQALSQIQFYGPALCKIHAELSTAEFHEEESSCSLPPSRKLVDAPAIQVDEIGFCYETSDQPVLNAVSLSISPRTSVAFVGNTGAGKTTLVDIILGLLRPTSGRLLVGDKSIWEDPEAFRAWRQCIGYVPQEIFLMDTTIASNIAFGLDLESLDMAKVEAAARAAMIHDFISEELPLGYATTVGERGVRLSGGQRQRLGIARALYGEPSILVFDEATSALDGQTERAVMEAIQGLVRSKTVIIIAHRLSTVKACDRIYFLERGTIVAEGTFEELESNHSGFRAMVAASATSNSGDVN